MNIFSHLVYAYSTFAETASAAAADPASGHDFVRLWAGGVHPYVSIVSMVALPLIIKTGIYLASQSATQRLRLQAQPATTQPVAALSTR
jgi:hypothetical protein